MRENNSDIPVSRLNVLKLFEEVAFKLKKTTLKDE